MADTHNVRAYPTASECIIAGEREARSAACVPLCGAAKAYGRFDRPWKHDPRCPVRIAWDDATASVQPYQRSLSALMDKLREAGPGATVRLVVGRRRDRLVVTDKDGRLVV